MIFLLDFLPKFCPNCGFGIDLKNPFAQKDFFEGTPHSCRSCHAAYQYAETDQLAEVATDAQSDAELTETELAA